MEKPTLSRKIFSSGPAAAVTEDAGAPLGAMAPEPAHAGRLLARCLQLADPGRARRALDALSSGAWQALVTESERQGVGPLLHDRLAHLEDLRIPPDAVRRLRDVYTYSYLRSIAVNERLDTLLTSADALGIPIILLKGAHLANHVYAEPALRPMNDLDVLVRSSDAERLRAAVLALDYRDMRGTERIDYSRHHHLKPLTRLGEVQVEVHHGLAPVEAPFAIDYSGLWERSETRVSNGKVHRLLAPHDLLLHLCTHAAYNHQFRVSLLAINDIDSTIRRHADTIDWHRLVSTANADGRSRCVHASLLLARELLLTPVHAAVLEELRHDSTDHDVVHAASEYILSGADDVPDGVKAVDAVDGVTRGLAIALRTIFPTTALLRQIYRLDADTRLVYLYAFFRPIDLLYRRGRTVIAILLRRGPARRALTRERQRRQISRWAEGL